MIQRERFYLPVWVRRGSWPIAAESIRGAKYPIRLLTLSHPLVGLVGEGENGRAPQASADRLRSASWGRYGACPEALRSASQGPAVPTEGPLWGPFDFKECPRSVQATILHNLSLRRNPLCMNKLPRMDSNHDKVM
jgi:hypothetical protein